MYKLLVSVSLILLLPAHLWATEDEPSKLLKAETLKCFFETGYTTTYDNGKLSEPEKSKKPFGEESTILDSIDLQKGTARLVGNNGAGALAVSSTFNSLNFVEVTPVGNVNLITVFDALEKSKNKYVAASSRHIATFMNEPMISQLFGSCVILEGR